MSLDVNWHTLDLNAPEDAGCGNASFLTQVRQLVDVMQGVIVLKMKGQLSNTGYFGIYVISA